MSVAEKQSMVFELIILKPFHFYHSQQATYIIRVWLTLHNCEIFYLSAVNYDPATTDLIFIRVNIYPGPEEGGLQLIF
jgi:hypothetical protein